MSMSRRDFVSLLGGGTAAALSASLEAAAEPPPFETIRRFSPTAQPVVDVSPPLKITTDLLRPGPATAVTMADGRKLPFVQAVHLTRISNGPPGWCHGVIVMVVRSQQYLGPFVEHGPPGSRPVVRLPVDPSFAALLPLSIELLRSEYNFDRSGQRDADAHVMTIVAARGMFELEITRPDQDLVFYACEGCGKTLPRSSDAVFTEEILDPLAVLEDHPARRMRLRYALALEYARCVNCGCQTFAKYVHRLHAFKRLTLHAEGGNAGYGLQDDFGGGDEYTNPNWAASCRCTIPVMSASEWRF